MLGDVLPADGRVFLDTALFLLVIVVLLVRPGRALHPLAPGLGARVRRLGAWSQLAAPVLCSRWSVWQAASPRAPIQFQFRFALVMATIVIALYVFVGNSGVVSFGHVSFVAVGGFAAGLTTVPEALKLSLSPDLFPVIASAEVGNAMSLVIASAVGGVFAFLVGVPLMRLSGLAAGIGTFAVLVITNNVLRNWEAIGPGARTLSLVPESTSFMQATVGVIAVAILAFLYQRSRWGRVLRASSEDPYAAQGSGVNIYRQRLVAFTLSGRARRLRRRPLRPPARAASRRSRSTSTWRSSRWPCSSSAGSGASGARSSAPCS